MDYQEDYILGWITRMDYFSFFLFSSASVHRFVARFPERARCVDVGWGPQQTVLCLVRVGLRTSFNGVLLVDKHFSIFYFF